MDKEALQNPRVIVIQKLYGHQINKETELNTTKGIVTTQSKLITAVNEIDNATSPLAKEVNKLEVTPPGAAAMIITPIANSGASGHNLTRKKAIIGNKIIWESAPTKKSRGCFKILEKSLPVKPIPKENIIKANAKGKKTSVTIPIFLTYYILCIY